MSQNFWEGFFKALGTEYKEIKEIKGVSGINHQIVSMGIDYSQKKIIIAQNEHDARILAMAQSDIQARLKDYNVLMIRPVPINLSQAFTHLSLLLGSNILSLKKLSKESSDNASEKFIEKNKNEIENAFKNLNPQIEIIQKTSLNLVPIFKELVHQLSHIKFIQDLDDNKGFDIDFEQMLSFNPIRFDNAVGVCPLPFYNFSMSEAESFLNPKNDEENKEILLKHNIYQFFNPPADSLTLGLIEYEKQSEKAIISTVKKIPNFGHPFGENELIKVDEINDIIGALKDKGLVVEGELGIDITEEGINRRASIKFSPRESIYKRISNIFSIKVDLSIKDLKDIFGN